MNSSDRIQFSQTNDQLVWRLPFRLLNQKERKEALAGVFGIVLAMLLLALFAIFGAANKITSDELGLAKLAVLVFAVAGFMALAVPLTWHLTLLMGRSQTIYRLRNGKLQVTESGFLPRTSKIRLDQIRQLIVKDSFQSFRKFGGVFWLPQYMPVIMARSDKKDFLVCYGYPLQLTRDLGKQMSNQLNKKWVDIGGEKIGVELRIDTSAEPLQPANSQIVCSSKGKTSQYSVRPTGLSGMVGVHFLVSAAAVAGFGFWAWQVAFVGELVNPLFLFPLVICFVGLAAMLWALHIGFERVTVQFDGNRMLVRETSIFGSANTELHTSRIREIYGVGFHQNSKMRISECGENYLPAGVRVELDNGQQFHLLDQLGELDLVWICYRLNQEVVGARAISRQPVRVPA